MTIRVLIVDDHPIVRHGLRKYLSIDPEIEVIGEAADGEQAVRLAEKLRPNVVLMDVLMPVMDGIRATSLIRRRYPEIRILVLTSANQDRFMVDAMAAGASAYLRKDAEVQELRLAINLVSSGQTYISQKLASQLIVQLGGSAMSSPLSEREEQVLQLLAKGYSNKEIAASLQIGMATVKTHVSTILAKLGVSSRTQAALHVNARDT